jgi:hypothetical protein
MKNIRRIVLFILLTSLLAACGQKSQDPNVAVAVVVALTQTAAAQSALTMPSAMPTPVEADTGVISGTVGGVAPPTPHMTVYALDTTTGKWASADVPPNNMLGTFSLIVPVGTYQLFAFGDNNAVSVYSTDWEKLTPVSVSANQTVSNINIQSVSTDGVPPECAQSVGVPASPDGKFIAVAGPAADCPAKITATQTAEASLQSGSIALIRVQFPAGSSSWSSPVDVLPNGTSGFILNASKGQTMTVTLNCSPPKSGSFYIRTADGIILLPRAYSSWTMVLPASQDYVTGVDNPTGQPINCILSVSIPPAAKAQSDPVSPNAQPALPIIAKTQAIRFATGPMDVILNGSVISGQRDRYTLSMAQGETLDVILNSSEGDAVFTILGPDGNPLMGTEEGKDINNWAVPVPSDGSYAIQVGPTRGNATYTLTVKVSDS